MLAISMANFLQSHRKMCVIPRRKAKFPRSERSTGRRLATEELQAGTVLLDMAI